MKNVEPVYCPVKDLFECWQILERDLFELCRQGKLKILISWGDLKKNCHNTACYHKDDWQPLEIDDCYPSFRFKSPCEECPDCNKAPNCIFEHPDKFLEIPDDDELDTMGPIHVKLKDLWVHQTEKYRFDQVQVQGEELKLLPSYLHPDHEFYCKEMAAMADTWNAIFEKKEILDDKTCKQAALRYMQKNYKDLGKIKSENLASIIHACFQGSPSEWNKFVQESKQK